MHLRNHDYFDYRENEKTPKLSPMPGAKWCISLVGGLGPTFSGTHSTSPKTKDFHLSFEKYILLIVPKYYSHTFIKMHLLIMLISSKL